MRNTQISKYIIASIVMVIVLVFTKKIYATTAIVNTETLNLRKEASIDSDIVEQLNLNTELEIIEEEGNWYKVKYSDKTGYVNKDYIKINDEGKTTTPVSTNPENTNSQYDNIIKSDAYIKILPIINSNTIGNVKSGESINIISKTNKWAFVQKEDISGWIPLTVFEAKNEDNTNIDNNEQEGTEQNPEEEPTTNQEEPENETIYENSLTKYINVESVYVRTQPTTDSEIVTTLIKNTDVTVVGENENWYKVKYDSLAGYIRKDLLSDDKVETTSRGGDVERTEGIEETQESNNNSGMGSQIVDYAKQYLGCPYVYGGSGPSSFDCSGFTMYVYKNFGYSLSHSATAQSKCGTYVSKENLQPGDLVFFLEYDTMDGIGHCGIYIGDGNFIHASSGTGYCVKISTLLSGSYYNRYATARRLI